MRLAKNFFLLCAATLLAGVVFHTAVLITDGGRPLPYPPSSLIADGGRPLPYPPKFPAMDGGRPLPYPPAQRLVV